MCARSGRTQTRTQQRSTACIATFVGSYSAALMSRRGPHAALQPPATLDPVDLWCGRRLSAVLWSGLALLCTQFTLFYWLTFYELSWDVMVNASTGFFSGVVGHGLSPCAHAVCAIRLIVSRRDGT